MEKITRTRIGSILLTMAMLLSLLPVTAGAESVTVESFENLKSAVLSADSGDTITVSGTITLTGDLEIPEGKELTLKGESDTAKLATSGQNTILVKGNLTIQNLQVGGKMDKGFAPITLVQSGAELHTDGMILVNSGDSASGYTVSAQGIQIAKAKGSDDAGPERCVIELKNSKIQVSGVGARGICFAGASDGTTITLDNTKILNGSNPLNEWLGGYSRGLALFNASNMTVNIQNNSQIAGFQYAINSGRDGATSGLRIFVNDSDIRGWTTFNVWTDGGVFSVENSTLTGMNGEYNGDKTYSFSAFVINRDIYNYGWGIAEDNQVILKDTTVNAITEDGQPVETLLRIDVDSTEVEFQGTVTFTDNTNGAAGAVLDIGNMDDPTAFMERHADLTDGVTVNTPNGNPLLPVYEVKNTFSDGQVSFGESFKTFISGVDYADAAKNNEKVILLQNVSEPEFAVNSEEGHGNKYGGWTLDLAGHTLTLKEWSGDKITVIDSSAEKTGDIIVDGESVLAARNGEKCYTSISDAIASVGDGDTIQVLKDIPDAVGISVPSGKNFTIDFGWHTYTLTGPGAGSPNTETNGFQLLKDSTITMKNGTIRIAENANDIKRIIQNYADLTLENMQFYAENQVGGENNALSFNNGNITFKGNTSVHTTSDDTVAFDVYYWAASYPDGTSVTFAPDYTGTINGVIVYDSTDSAKGTLTIQGNGTFGNIEASTGSEEAAKQGISIYSGTILNPVPQEYIAPGMEQDENGKVVIDTDTAVAEINGVGYTSLTAALNAASDGQTVKLLSNSTGNTQVKIEDGRKLTLDMNGFNAGFVQNGNISIYHGGLDIIDSGKLYEEAPWFAPVVLYGSDDPTATDYTTVTVGEDVTLEGWAGLFIDQHDAHGATAYGIKATVNGTLHSVKDTSGAGGHALYINGTIKATDGNVPEIILNGATLNTDLGNGMYLAGYAKTTITDSTITSVGTDSTGIEIRAGELTINGNTTVKGGTGEFVVEANGNGSTTGNVALAIVQHTSKLPTVVTINGGTFSGGAALFEQNAQNNDADAVAKIQVFVNGGTFKDQVYSENKADFISGGHFSEPVDEKYLDNSLNAQLKSASNPEAPYSYYTSLDAALAAAEPGDVVTPIQTGSTIKTYTVTLDYNDGSTGNVTCTVEENNSITLPTPTRSGYDFLGWYAGSTKVSSSYKVTGNVTLVAQWSYIDQGSSSGSSEPSGDYIVSVDRVSGGKVTVNPGRADKGDEVTVTVKPSEGYELDELVVTDSKGNEVRVYAESSTKFTFTMPSGTVDVKASFVKIDAGSVLDDFADLNPNAWYAEAVEFVIEEGLMTGTSAAAFAPDASMSRAMIWTVLAAYNGYNTSGGNPWYAPGQQWAMINGVSDGTSPDGSITREQLAVMLWRAAGSPETDKSLSGYADASSVSDWAETAMAWAVDNGIITGMGGSTLAPQATATRAQVAVMLMQFVDYMED